MKRRKWTTKQAWAYLAKRWAAAEREASRDATVFGSTVPGLCGSVARLKDL